MTIISTGSPLLQKKIPLQVIIVEDSENDALLVVRELRKAGYEPRWARVETGGELQVQLQNGDWDLVITDHNLPGFTSVDALKIVRGAGDDIPVICHDPE